MLVLVPDTSRGALPASPLWGGTCAQRSGGLRDMAVLSPGEGQGWPWGHVPHLWDSPPFRHVGARQEQVSHGRPHFLPFIVKVSTKPLLGPWRAQLRPPELPAWPWPLVFSFHSRYLWGHLKGSNWSPMEFHPVSDKTAHEQHLSLVPHGDHVSLWPLPGLCAGVAPQNSTRGKNVAPKQPGKQQCVTLEIISGINLHRSAALVCPSSHPPHRLVTPMAWGGSTPGPEQGHGPEREARDWMTVCGCAPVLPGELGALPSSSSSDSACLSWDT